MPAGSLRGATGCRAVAPPGSCHARQARPEQQERHRFRHTGWPVNQRRGDPEHRAGAHEFTEIACAQVDEARALVGGAAWDRRRQRERAKIVVAEGLDAEAAIRNPDRERELAGRDGEAKVDAGVDRGADGCGRAGRVDRQVAEGGVVCGSG